MSPFVLRRDGRPTPEWAARTWAQLRERGELVSRRWLAAPPPTEAHWHAAEAAFGAYTAALSREWPGQRPQGTPGLTGLALLANSTPARGRGRAQRGHPYVQLPPQERALVTRTAVQHRYQVFWDGHPVRRVLHFDARLAYLACCRGVPVLHRPDDLIHDDRPEVDPARPGRYRVEVTVPAGWRSVGLAPRDTGRRRDQRWAWPDRTGVTWETWADRQDLRLLETAGWTFSVRERLLFAPEDTPGGDPLRTWAGRLRALLQEADASPRPTAFARQVAHYYRTYLRSTALHAIGKLAAHEREETAAIGPGGALPAGEGWAPEVSPTGELLARRRVPFAAQGAWAVRWEHPEWAAAIWDHARRRTLRRLLDLPPAARFDLVADDVYVADHDPGWPDAGAIGDYRLKGMATFPQGLCRPPGAPEVGPRALAQQLGSWLRPPLAGGGQRGVR